VLFDLRCHILKHSSPAQFFYKIIHGLISSLFESANIEDCFGSLKGGSQIPGISQILYKT